jgi:hypothetical protein
MVRLAVEKNPPDFLLLPWAAAGLGKRSFYSRGDTFPVVFSIMICSYRITLTFLRNGKGKPDSNPELLRLQFGVTPHSLDIYIIFKYENGV